MDQYEPTGSLRLAYDLGTPQAYNMGRLGRCVCCEAGLQ